MASEGTIGRFTGNNSNKNSSYGQSSIGELFLTKMLSNPNYKTVITLPNSMGRVTGFCEGPFSFSGTADWKPIIDLGQAEDQVAAVTSVAAAFGGQMNPGTEKVGQFSFKQIRGTEMRYSGSGTPTFQIKLILPSYDSNAKQKPIDSVKLLMACVFPQYKTLGAVGDQLQAPLGYGIIFNENQRSDAPYNTVSLRRGRFFYARDLLIRQVSSEFSQECMEDGYPLYTAVNIELIPWRMLDYKEAMSWFGQFNNWS